MRTICVFTGSRAEYGLLRPLIRAMREEPGLDLQLLVGGSHLSAGQGRTAGEIEADGNPIAALAAVELADDSPAAVCQALGAAVQATGEALGRLGPDILVLLGDRWEVLAAACAAALLRIPVAHIHGGEASFGAVDDAFRHAVTKLAHLHFVAAEAYRRRVVQLGEDPGRVFCVGALGAAGLRELTLLTRDELSRELSLDLSGPFALVTFHPATLDTDVDADAVQCRNLLAALDAVPELALVLTRAGADAGGAAVNRRLERFAAERPGRCRLFASLGQRRYVSAMRHAAVVAGNSSSGLLEAPSFGVPVVNVGDRQKGRIRAANVIDCGTAREDIQAAQARALSPEFRACLAGMLNPVERPGTIRLIVEQLKAADLSALLKKEFHDLPDGRP